MSGHASGAFEVKLTPVATDEKPAIAKMTIDKKFQGDLEGTSKGEMLAVGPDAQSSGGYVAMEVVSGRLSGRNGTFVLLHTGTMTRGAPQLSIAVVPDSATGELVGLTGSMAIQIKDGKHSYEFQYTLPNK